MSCKVEFVNCSTPNETKRNGGQRKKYYSKPKDHKYAQ